MAQGGVNADDCAWRCVSNYYHVADGGANGGRCSECSNQTCAVNEYRSGRCSHADGNGLVCNACASDCGVGRFRTACSGTSAGTCTSCRNGPANATYTSEGSVNAAGAGDCAWTCNEGFYKDGNTCRACANQLCAPGSYRTGECSHAAGNGFQCNACATNCGIGRARTGCSGTSEGRCEACTNLPARASFTTQGQVNAVGSCSWACDTDARVSADGTSCTQCENTSCGAGKYRTGTCGADAKGYQCAACQANCDLGKFRYDSTPLNRVSSRRRPISVTASPLSMLAGKTDMDPHISRPTSSSTSGASPCHHCARSGHIAASDVVRLRAWTHNQLIDH